MHCHLALIASYLQANFCICSNAGCIDYGQDILCRALLRALGCVAIWQHRLLLLKVCVLTVYFCEQCQEMGG